jgi:hypothetical protein
LKQLKLIQILRINVWHAAAMVDARAKASRVNRLLQASDGVKAASGNADTAFEV